MKDFNYKSKLSYIQCFTITFFNENLKISRKYYKGTKNNKGKMTLQILHET